jgi:hypothetical protein
MTREYPWYETVNGEEPLSQGDFIDDCPILIPSSDISKKEIDGKIVKYNVVIMSQSCDLWYKKLDLVLVCPVWPLSDFEKINPHYKDRRAKEALRQGYTPGYHLLNECKIDGFKRDFFVVDFRNVYGVPFDLLIDLAKKKGRRLRILPPYREHLSQAFARFFMRVGLPLDIPEFK